MGDMSAGQARLGWEQSTMVFWHFAGWFETDQYTREYSRALLHLQEDPRKIGWRNSSVRLWWLRRLRQHQHQLSMNFDFLVSQFLSSNVRAKYWNIILPKRFFFEMWNIFEMSFWLFWLYFFCVKIHKLGFPHQRLFYHSWRTSWS